MKKEIDVRRHQALIREADATKDLMESVGTMAGYRDPSGNGPEAHSLAGIMKAGNKRIKARFDHAVTDMPEDMLDVVSLLKRNMARAIRRKMREEAEYADIKKELWTLIDQSAIDYFTRCAA